MQGNASRFPAGRWLLAAPLIGLLWLPLGVLLAARLASDASGPSNAQVFLIGWPMFAAFCVALVCFFWLVFLSLRTRVPPRAAVWERAVAWSGLVLLLPPRTEDERVGRRRALGLALVFAGCVGFGFAYMAAAAALISFGGPPV
jgi:drug/metabolite transporter (DMT)-like permease